MKCILCDREIQEHELSSPCSFHPGICSFAFTTGAGDGMYDNSMGYRDIYFWSCCGLRQPSNLSEQESPPLRSEKGCFNSKNHVFNANVLLLYSLSFNDFSIIVKAALKKEGILINNTNIRASVENLLNEYEAIVYLLSEDRDEHALLEIEKIKLNHPLLPFIVFSPPEHLNNYKVQGNSTNNINDALFSQAIKSAIRHRYMPEKRWEPHVFLSYSRQENNKMEEFYWEFSRHTGGCWADNHMLASGVLWSEEIRKNIEACRLFVFVLTPNIKEESYCWLEFEIAVKSEKPIFIIPFGDALGKFLKREEIYGKQWQKMNLEYYWTKTLSHKYSIIVDNCSKPTFVILDKIGDKIPYEDFLSAKWNRTSCISDWLRMTKDWSTILETASIVPVDIYSV